MVTPQVSVQLICRESRQKVNAPLSDKQSVKKCGDIVLLAADLEKQSVVYLLPCVH